VGQTEGLGWHPEFVGLALDEAAVFGIPEGPVDGCPYTFIRMTSTADSLIEDS